MVRRSAAVALTLAAGAGLAGIAWSLWPEQRVPGDGRGEDAPTSDSVVEAPPPPPPPPDPEQLLALQQLAARTEAFGDAGAADVDTLRELLTAAEELADPSLETLDPWLNLLAGLGFCTTCCSNHTAVAAPAARLARLYEASLARLRDRTLPASVHRNYAEVCLHAGDLARLAQAVDGGLAVLADAEPTERAQLLTFACRLHCLLGRLDVAAGFSVRAMAAAGDSVRAAEQVTDPELAAWSVAAAGNCLRNAAFATADLHLLDGDFDGALEMLQRLPPEDGAAGFYRNLIAAMQGDRDAEHKLADICANHRLPPSLSSLACPKLIQVALLRGDDDTAAERYATFAELSPSANDDRRGHWSTLAIELALRGRLAADEALRDRARRAYRSMLARWRAAPQLPGGIGFLHLDDRATLLANLLRLEAKLAPDGDGEAGLRLLLEAHRRSPGSEQPRDAAVVRERLLGDRHGLVVLVPGRYASVQLVVTAGTVQLQALAPAAELRRGIDALRTAGESFLIGAPGAAADLRAAGATVASALLPAELRERLAAWRRLTVCGAGLLQNVPFDLLPLDVDGAATRLGWQLAIDYVPDLVAAADHERPARTNGPLLLAASLLTTATGAPRYEVPRDLIQACTKPYRERRQADLVWTDADVRVGRVLAKLPGARIAHLVGHGIEDRTRAFAHGIAFGDGAGDVLWGERVLGLDLSGLVVMLSSCRAGDAPWRRGGDPLAASLAGAMLAAGARCVMVPTTEVRLQRHLQAMARVHEQLAAGSTPSVALREARRARATEDADGIELLLVQVHGRGF